MDITVSAMWGEILCAIVVGGGLGILSATILEWRRERQELISQNQELRERIRKLDQRTGWELLSDS